MFFYEEFVVPGITGVRGVFFSWLLFLLGLLSFNGIVSGVI